MSMLDRHRSTTNSSELIILRYWSLRNWSLSMELRIRTKQELLSIAKKLYLIRRAEQGPCYNLGYLRNPQARLRAFAAGSLLPGAVSIQGLVDVGRYKFVIDAMPAGIPPVAQQ